MEEAKKDHLLENTAEDNSGTLNNCDSNPEFDISLSNRKELQQSLKGWLESSRDVINIEVK